MDLIDDTENNEYAWLGGYEKTWEDLKEDEQGSIRSSVATFVQKSKRNLVLKRKKDVRIGMMRNLFIVIDMSKCMYEQDFKPNRLQATTKLLEKFIEEFFDQNPISQIGLMTLKNKRCEKLTDLTGNTKLHLTALKKLRDSFCQGEASLYNAIDQSFKILKHTPGHVSKEILVVYGSLSTVDPSSIDDLIQVLKTNNVRCSIIGLSASMFICQKIASETQGRYQVALEESHMKALLEEHLLPPVAVSNESSLIKMGFPQLDLSPTARLSMCMCHMESTDMKECFGKAGYLCPQCSSKYCDLPVECIVCGLTLASSAHLARSYHHLFPLDPFVEISSHTLSGKSRFCQGCQKALNEPNAFQCKKCNHHFCTDCDIFIHGSLHSCPGCATKPSSDLL